MDKIIDIYLNPNGRVGRLKFFLYSLGFGIPAVLIASLMERNLIFQLFWIPFVGYVTVVEVKKRFNDLNRSGWYYLALSFVPLYQLYLVFILLFKRGTVGTNRYGPDPLLKPSRKKLSGKVFNKMQKAS